MWTTNNKTAKGNNTIYNMPPPNIRQLWVAKADGFWIHKSYVTFLTWSCTMNNLNFKTDASSGLWWANLQLVRLCKYMLVQSLYISLFVKQNVSSIYLIRPWYIRLEKMLMMLWLSHINIEHITLSLRSSNRCWTHVCSIIPVVMHLYLTSLLDLVMGFCLHVFQDMRFWPWKIQKPKINQKRKINISLGSPA